MIAAHPAIRHPSPSQRARRLALPAAALALALAPALPALAAPAADLSGFRLRPSQGTTRAPGPVDEQNPVIITPRRETPTPAPTQQATPQASNEAAAEPVPARRANATRRPPPPAPKAASTDDFTPAAPGEPGSAPRLAPETPPSASGTYVPVPALPAGPIAAPPMASDSTAGWLWLLAAFVAGLATAVGLLLVRNKRERPLPVPEIERPIVLPGATPARPAAVPAPPEPLPDAAAVALDPASAIALSLTAVRMSATLVNTVLSYRLSVINRSDRTLSDLSVCGDMIAAHASLPVEQQLGAGTAELPALHRIEQLAAGESRMLTGDIRLPLVSITPIRRGAAALFVPLARFSAAAVDEHGQGERAMSAFLVGQPAAKAGRLQPFRLDLGPRNYSQLGQRLLPQPA